MRRCNYLAFRNAFDLIVVRNEQLYSTCSNQVDHPQSVGGGRIHKVCTFFFVFLVCLKTHNTQSGDLAGGCSSLLSSMMLLPWGSFWMLFKRICGALRKHSLCGWETTRDTLDCTSCRASRWNKREKKCLKKRRHY